MRTPYIIKTFLEKKQNNSQLYPKKEQSLQIQKATPLASMRTKCLEKKASPMNPDVQHGDLIPMRFQSTFTMIIARFTTAMGILSDFMIRIGDHITAMDFTTLTDMDFITDMDMGSLTPTTRGDGTLVGEAIMVTDITPTTTMDIHIILPTTVVMQPIAPHAETPIPQIPVTGEMPMRAVFQGYRVIRIPEMFVLQELTVMPVHIKPGLPELDPPQAR